MVPLESNFRFWPEAADQCMLTEYLLGDGTGHERLVVFRCVSNAV